MTRKLDYNTKGPQSGTVKSIVVFLHGYGADGADLLGLADPLAPHLPDTLFIAPDAPEPCRGNPFGRQWFPIPWLDGSPESAAAEGLAQSAADLQAFLDERLAEAGLPDAALALVGFSQGTMMSLEVAPRRDAQIACVVGFSGRLIAPERLAAEKRATPPILLLHGDADEVVPFASLEAAGNALSGAGFEVFAHVMRGTGHGIAPDGLSSALYFLRQNLPA
ncbi:alpha/beta fold hydrolase [Frigidibacter sp. MR17.14]|uniref:alpha/beta hydrolase n=1 Tax=Frigidibacter sp. MR17.14 TaxID=3126509 RepID=UPI003012B73D